MYYDPCFFNGHRLEAWRYESDSRFHICCIKDFPEESEPGFDCVSSARKRIEGVVQVIGWIDDAPSRKIVIKGLKEVIDMAKLNDSLGRWMSSKTRNKINSFVNAIEELKTMQYNPLPQEPENFLFFTEERLKKWTTNCVCISKDFPDPRIEGFAHTQGDWGFFSCFMVDGWFHDIPSRKGVSARIRKILRAVKEHYASEDDVPLAARIKLRGLRMAVKELETTPTVPIEIKKTKFFTPERLEAWREHHLLTLDFPNPDNIWDFCDVNRCSAQISKHMVKGWMLNEQSRLAVAKNIKEVISVVEKRYASDDDMFLAVRIKVHALRVALTELEALEA